MTNFVEFKEMIKKKGFSSSQVNYINGEPVYLSRGICEIFLESEEQEQKLRNVIRLFQNNDFGSASEMGKERKAGHEYGRYQITSFDLCDDDTAVWIHRMEDAIKVYFRFER